VVSVKLNVCVNEQQVSTFSFQELVSKCVASTLDKAFIEHARKGHIHFVMLHDVGHGNQ
jgi:hypothetical protein